MMSPRKIAFRPVVLLVCLLAASPAPAQVPPESSPADAAARLPRSSEIVIIVDRASAIRESSAWRGLEAALAHFAPVAAVEKDPGDAWSALARTLGWTEDETFDRLLGRRVMLVMTLAEKGRSEPTWALVCDATAETDRRLRERLRAAPRGIVQGHQVLAIESGNYELTTHATRAGRKSPASATLILGPAGRSALFDEMIGVVADGAAEPLAQTPAIAAARTLGPADVLALVRLDRAAPAAGARPWDDFVAVACRRDKAAWNAALVVHQAEAVAELRSVPATTDAAFQSLARGSLVAVAETRLGQPAGEDAGPLSALFDRIGIPDAMRGILGKRQAVVVRATPSAPGLAAAIALDTSDSASMARSADAFVASTVDSIERAYRQGEKPLLVPDFHAMAPDAVRVLPLAVPQPATEAVFGPSRPMIAWTTRPAGPSGGTGQPAPGWWTLAVAPSESEDDPAAPDLARSVAGALQAGEPAGNSWGGGDKEKAARRRGVTQPWITVGAVRPAGIEAALGGRVPDVASWRGVCRSIESIDWSVWATPEGEMAGTIELRLVVPEAPAPNGSAR